MAHPDEVPDDQKDPGHTIPKDDWEKVRADAAVYAEEDTDDLDVPEPDDEDFAGEGFDETPDEMTRGETL